MIKKIRRLVFGIVGLPITLLARTATIDAPAPSAFIDAETSTNVPFNVRRSDTRSFNVRLELAGTVSNCVQVAFGRDADGDGDLAPEETDLVMGWRRGRYFVEDVANDERQFSETVQANGAARFLELSVATDAAFRPKTAAFASEAGVLFADIGVRPCFFSANWNLAKVTRRGTDAANEWCRIANDYRKFEIRIR